MAFVLSAGQRHETTAFEGPMGGGPSGERVGADRSCARTA